MADTLQTDPRLSEALQALRKCGYAVGLSSVSAQGHTMVTIGGRMLAQEDILKMAGMDDSAPNQPDPQRH